MSLFSSDIFYIRISPKLLSIKAFPSKTVFEDVPQLAIRKVRNRYKVIAVGKAADLAAEGSDEETLILNGFDHPRTIIADIEVAEKTLQHFLKKVISKGILKQPAILILHPMEKLEGGLTMVESRGLEYIGRRAGYNRIHIWTGKELSDEEVISLSFVKKERR